MLSVRTSWSVSSPSSPPLRLVESDRAGSTFRRTLRLFEEEVGGSTMEVLVEVPDGAVMAVDMAVGAVVSD